MNITEEKLIEKAHEIAREAHKNQVRKTDGSPYINHPLAVADILKSYDFNEVVISAAITHDVLEDTDTSESKLRSLLGDEVVDIVVAVSEDKELPWEERKEKYTSRIAEANDETKAVSVADKIHNAQSLIASHKIDGPKVWKVFNRDKEKKIWFERLLLSKLQKTWSHPLLDEYVDLINQLEQLEE